MRAPGEGVRRPAFEPATTALIRSLRDEWKERTALLAAGAEPAAACLVSGPSGTGKTSLALWLAAQLNLPALVTRADTILDVSPVATASNIRSVFGHAASRPCLLVVEDLDVLTAQHDGERAPTGAAKASAVAFLACLAARRRVGLTLA